MDMDMELDPPAVTDADVLSALERAEGANPVSKAAALEVAGGVLRVSSPLPDAQSLLHALRGSLRSAQQDVASAAFVMVQTYAARLNVEAAAVAHDPATQAHALRLARVFTHISLPLSVERLADPRPKTKSSANDAVQALAALVIALPHAAGGAASVRGRTTESPLDTFVNTFIGSGVQAKQPRVREASLALFPIIKDAHTAFPIRPFTTPFVAALADADPKVREAAKGAIVPIFARASPPARAELHRELDKQGIRKPMVESLLADIAAAGSGAGPSTATVPTQEGGDQSAPPPPPSPTQPNFTHLGSEEYKPSIGMRVDTPTYASSAGELERMLLGMEPHFQGIETEKNWTPRQADIVKLRGLLVHELPPGVRSALPTHIKLLQDGIIKTAGTLRTTLALQSIALIEELVVALNDELGQNGMAEAFLSAMLRVSAGTKKITANAAQTTIGAILQCVPFRPAFLHALQFVVGDKSIQVRIAVAGYIKCLLYTYCPGSRSLAATAANGSGRSKFLARSNIDTVVQAIAQELVDSNRDVRATARKTFWLLHALPQARNEADALLNKLDFKTKGVILNDTTAREEAEDDTNPNKCAASVTSSGSNLRRARGGASVALMQAKRAAAERMARERSGKPTPEPELPAPAVSPMIEWGGPPPSPSTHQDPVSPESKVQQWQQEMTSSPLLAPTADMSIDEASPPAPVPQPLNPSPPQKMFDPATDQFDQPVAASTTPAEPRTVSMVSSDDGRTDRGRAPAESVSTLGPAPSPRDEVPSTVLPHDAGHGDISLPDAEAQPPSQPQSTPTSAQPPTRHPALKELEPVTHWSTLLKQRDPNLNFFRKLSRWASYPARDDQGHDHPLAHSPAATAELLQLLFELVRTKAKAKAVEPALATLIVLQRLAMHHTVDAITLSGQQDHLVQLTLDPLLAQEPLRYGTPCEGILSAWATRTDSVLCLRTLVACCPTTEEDNSSISSATAAAAAAAVLKLVLQVIAKLLQQMPAEVIEDELPRLRSPLRIGLLHPAPDVRAAANSTVLSAAQELQSTTAVFDVLAPLTQGQQDLILYYFAKRRGTRGY